MRNLAELGLRAVLGEVIAAGEPSIGISVGYQLLFEHSTENDAACLGLLSGNVIRFPTGLKEAGSDRPLKIPEMGWNRVEFVKDHPVWQGVPEGSEFYFVHSYYPEPDSDAICATTTYGIEYACGVSRNNLVAFQFHPEKSGRPGLKILENFARWDGQC